MLVGVSVGQRDGTEEGFCDGRLVVGAYVGSKDGFCDGMLVVGAWDGVAVGS